MGNKIQHIFYFVHVFLKIIKKYSIQKSYFMS